MKRVITQQEKQLLLKDLSARFPYNVVVRCTDSDTDYKCFLTTDILHEIQNGYEYYDYKPYLRPMSSMTAEESRELYAIRKSTQMTYSLEPKELDWLNAHHFDYRGLIEKGLALEAPAGMYNKEEPEKGSDIPVPKTVDEAISTLEKILSDEDREYLLENGAISMHDSLGRWIRNEWGLWTGSELKDELMNMNKGLNHPDDMSNYIIEEFIKYWNNKL